MGRRLSYGHCRKTEAPPARGPFPTHRVSSAAPNPPIADPVARPPRYRRPLGSRLLRVFGWLLLIAYFVAGLGYLTLRYLVWPNPAYWLPRAEQVLSEAIGRPVAVGEVRAGFDGLRPSLEVRELTIAGDEGAPAFTASRLYAVLSLRSLATGQLRFARLDVDAPALRIERLDDRRLRVAGIVFDLASPGGGDGGGAVAWLFAQRRIVLRGVDLHWFDQVADRSLRFEGVDLAVGSVGRRHRASLHIPEAAGLGRELRASIEFLRPALSGAADWRQWNGELHLSAGHADLAVAASLARDLGGLLPGAPADVRPGAKPAADGAPPAGLEVTAGAGAFQLWTHFERGVPVDGLARLSGAGMAMRLDGSPVPLAAVDVEAELRRAGSGESQLRLRRFSLRDDSGFELRSAAGAQQTLRFDADGALAGGAIALERFESASLLAVVRAMPLPDAVRQRFATMRLSGSIERLGVTWERTARYAVEARFEGLSFSRGGPAPPPGWLGTPSFRNVSGSVTLDQTGGRLAIAGRKTVLSFPGLFAEPDVRLEAVDARADWRMRVGPDGAPEGVVFEIDSLRFANADAAGELSGRYESGGKGIGLIDLSGRLSRADATRVARYMPLWLSAGVRGWVEGAIVAGRFDDVRFVLRGDLWDFPYRDPGSGVFRIEAALSDATLRYAPDWPAIERIRARLLFERGGMEIAAESGQVSGVTLGATRATIAEYREAMLRIEGGGEGPAQDMVRFVKDSPLRERIGDYAPDLEIGGVAKLVLKLEMPLDDIATTRVEGVVQLAGNDVVVDRTLPALSQVSGRLEFSESALSLREIAGGFLGGTVRVDAQMPEAGGFAVQASGRASAAGIRQFADDPLTAALDGSAAWRAVVDIGRGPARLSIESDLVGLASRLPAPFGKPADAAWPLRIESAPAAPAAPAAATGAPAREWLRIALRDDVRLLFERERDDRTKRMRVLRGVFAMGSEPLMPDAGFAVRLDAPTIDVDAWSAILGPALEREGAVAVGPGAAPGTAVAAAADAGRPFSLLPSQLSMVAGELRIRGKDLHDVVAGATRSGGVWQASVHSREIAGYFNWRAALPGQPLGTLTARFARLEIPRSRVEEFESLLDSAPSALPALDIAADEFVLDERRLGRLALKAVNAGTVAAPVWQLEQLRIEHPAATLTARGDWQTPRGARQRTTSLDFDLTVRDAGGILDTFGFSDTMRAAPGRLGGRIAWTGSPLSIDYPSLAGELSLDLGKGQFLKTEPGVAKLIGVLNLQSLRRRLTFDFRDLFAEGFVFDDIRGNIKVARGVARSDDFRMRGVTAEVLIVGEVNLVAETQNLLVEVRPELNAGLASLAYAALVNPAIGLGSLVAQWLLRAPLQEMFTFEYEVAGSWSDPTAVRKSRPSIEAEAPPIGGG